MERKLSFNRLKLVIVALFILTIGTVQTANAQETTWVLDETNDLSQETLEYISHLNEEIFVNFDIEPQLAIEILKELPEGYADIDEYRNERFKELGVGHREHDSGILFVIALDVRKMGIETGYGAEAIVRDIEAQQIISGEVRDSLGEYMSDSNPEYLNRSIVKAADEISILLDKGNTGVIFEEREEEQNRLEEERQANALAQKEFGAKVSSGFRLLITTLIGLLGLTRVRSWYKKKKLEELMDEVTTSYISYYKQNLPDTIKDEMSQQEFQNIFEENFDYYMDKYAPNQEFDEIWESRPDIITDIRVIHYGNKIKESKLSLDPRVYLNASKEYQENIHKVPDYTIKGHIQIVERNYQNKKKQVADYNNKLMSIIEAEIVNYKQAAVGYSPWVFDNKATYRHLAQRYHLNEEGIITGELNLADEKLVKSDIQQFIYHNIVEDIMKDEFKDSSYGYGNSRAFRNFVIAGVIGSMSYLSRDRLIQHMERLLTKYRRSEEEKEMERIRIAKRRRREEEERRRRQAASRSSSSSSSSSSGGSFGGGFGGGSSGGGGASGGF